MKPTALQAAKARLESARTAADAIADDSKTFEAIQEEWWKFLMAANGVYAKLEQGAKGFGKSDNWFGQKKSERKKDALLAYLHHARNAEEHGLEGSSRIAMDMISKRKDVTIQRDVDGVATGINVPPNLPAGTSLVQMVPPGIWLKVVTNRGSTYPPPNDHLGNPVADKDPATIAKLGCDYLAEMIREAEQLPPT